MAISAYLDISEVIDLKEFRRRVRAKVDPSQPDTLMNAAPDLLALANDGGLMARLIREDLRQLSEKAPRMYTPQSYLLDSFDVYSVRINLWKAGQRLTDAETSYFSYLSYHNHDFPFITANYYGPGYRTSIYEGEADWQSATPGQPVDLRFLEETSLPPGKVMYYRKWLDVHSQLPPTADSASLNLMLDNPDDLDRNQFYFDVDTQEIVGRVENTVAKRLAALEVGRFLGSSDVIEPLKRLAETTSCAATAAKAEEVAAALARRRPR